MDGKKGISLKVTDIQQIARLIDNLELCHHKAERHVELILQAIAQGSTTKGYQARETASSHPATAMWRNAITVLGEWLVGATAPPASLDVGGHTGSELAHAIGALTELKAWQVRQVINKLKHASRLYPDVEYYEMVEYLERYADCRAFRDQTVNTIIHDTCDGEPATISLAAAIDHLQPCNWNFSDNLLLVLRAIDGQLYPEKPFAAHGRNARLNPIRERMRVVAATLCAFCEAPAGVIVDDMLLKVLGEATDARKTLALRLEAKISEVFGANA